MRQKRAKAYRKQMSYYHMNFKFREPYQLLVDDEIILESVRIKMDLVKALERTVQGQVKPLITQCCMEALYRSEDQRAIEVGKSFERRRCGHRPAPKGRAAVAAAAAEEAAAKVAAAAAEAEAAEREADGNDESTGKKSSKSHKPQKPTTTDQEEDDTGPKKPHDCLWNVIVHNNQNKHRYVVATQKDKLRNRLRRIPAVPMLYLNRSVMIMEPMSDITARARSLLEHKKLSQGLNDPQAAFKLQSKDQDKDAEAEAKAKGGEDNGLHVNVEDHEGDDENTKQKKKIRTGPKQPNPLSMKRKKKSGGENRASNQQQAPQQKELPQLEGGDKKKRRRRTHAGASKNDDNTKSENVMEVDE